MTRYSEEQIRDAIQKAAEKNTPGPVYAWELSMYKKVIDALPEPQDDWEACAFEDIRKGDRVKNVLVTESGQIHTIEGVANYYSEGGSLRWWFTKKASGRDSGVDQYIARSDEPHGGPIQVTLYRIPAPVTHPDPEQHPVIIVHELNGVPVKGLPGPFMWAYGKYVRPMPNHTTWKQDPHTITEWSPAKVVADNA